MLTYAIYCIYGCASASLPLSKALSSAWDALQQCWVILLTGSLSLLLCACSSHWCLCIKSRIRLSGSTRWHSWQNRNRCRCVSSPGSELFLCSTNWFFVTNIFCNEDVFWAGGSDTCALGCSQLNKLLVLCTGIRVGSGLPQIQTMGHLAFSSRYCRSLQNSGMFDFIGIWCSWRENAKNQGDGCAQTGQKMHLFFWTAAFTGEYKMQLGVPHSWKITPACSNTPSCEA